MPKDPTRNINQYKIDGGRLNEFEFDRNQGEITREERQRFERREGERESRADEAQPAPTLAEDVAQMMVDAKEKAAKNLRRQGKNARNAPAPVARKSAARKSPGKKIASRAAEKAGSKKRTAKKGAGAAKKATAKKGAAKRTGKLISQSARKALGRGRAAQTGGKKRPVKKGRTPAR